MKRIFAVGVFALMLVSALSTTINVAKTEVVKDEETTAFHSSIDQFVLLMEEKLNGNLPDDPEAQCTKKTYMVPMRDGVKLATDVYLPLAHGSPHGSVLLQTPYGKNDLAALGYLFAVLGWPAVIQDMRGCGESDGNNTVFRNSHTDGPDTLAWIATQSWSNGKVATVGPSALGICQYLMAGANPPELACQGIMVASPNLYKHAIYQGGEFRKELVEIWLGSQDALYVLPEIFANENYSLGFWTNVSLDDNWQNVSVPAIHMGGWYDAFLQGIVDGYDGYQHHAGAGALGKSKLVMGPWTHEGYITTKQGELTYPENSLCWFTIDGFLDMIKQYTMGEGNAFDKWPAVSYYVMGDVNDIDAPGNEWRYANDWPIPATNVSWYFYENGELSKTIPGSDAPITYTYDPTNPVPNLGGQNLNLKPGPHDQTSVESRDDVIVFTGPVLTEPYEATGPIKAHLFVSSDCLDTDFTVKLTDVYPDGRSMIITDGILRMRNRNGPDHWAWMQPGEIYEIDVGMLTTSYIWNAGHRIRVEVSSSNYPRFLANPNTPDPITKNATYLVAHNTLYLDSIHPSCIILPEIAPGSPSTPPDKPSKPSGSKHIKINKSYSFTSATTDPDGDKVSLLFDWGDGTWSGWLGPYKSGEMVKARHIWKEKGTYTIRVKAKDFNGTQSEWSDPMVISMPRDRGMTGSLLLKLLERFPRLFPFIRNLFI
jgi:uncharacterized protein